MPRLLSKERMRDLPLGLVLLHAILALMLYLQSFMGAAKSGPALCYSVTIPSLFPSFIPSSLMVELGLAGCLGCLLEGLMRPLFHVSGVCASAFALDFIGGYLVGVKTTTDLYESGICTETETECLLASRNSSDPAFIPGVVGVGALVGSRVGIPLYLVYTIASICISILFRFYKAGLTARREERQSRPQFHTQRFTTAFIGSTKSPFLSILSIYAFVVFSAMAIQFFIRSGFLLGLAQVLGTVLAPSGLAPEWAQCLPTGALEIFSGVWTFFGDGTFSGKFILVVFMLGWAGIFVHCQVLSFIKGSGLFMGTYLVGKLFHGGLFALFITVPVRFFPLETPISDYLADQVAGIADMDFHRTPIILLVCVWVLFLFFLFVVAAVARKGFGGRYRNVL